MLQTLTALGHAVETGDGKATETALQDLAAYTKRLAATVMAERGAREKANAPA